MQKIFLPAKIEEIDKAIDFISSTLNNYKIKGKEKTRALLLAEEAMVKLIANAKDGEKMQICIKRLYNTANITLSSMGAPFDGDDFIAPITGLGSGHGSEEAIRSMLLRANSGRIAYSRRGEYNFVKIGAGAKERLFALRTLFAFIAAIVVAVILSLIISEKSMNIVNENLLVPIEDVFLKALKLVTAPAVFFSLTTVVARMTSFSDPGRITVKIITAYVITSIISVLIGIFVFKGFELFGGFNFVLQDAVPNASISINQKPIYETFINFIPGNIVEPFLNTDSVQLLVIAILAGFALGKVGTYSTFLSNLAGALDKFFSSIVEIVSNVVPAATFFVTLLSLFYFRSNALFAAFKILAMVILGFAVMIFGTLLYILIIGRLNPIIFIKKTWKTIYSTFLGGSSLSAVADTTRLCEKQLGVSPKLAAFSIPFGATSNLNGNCIYLTIAGLSLAKLCNIDIFGKGLITIAFMVLILSIGSPITPGSAMLAITMLMTQMGISLVAISILLGLNALIEMLLAAFNTIDDIATTLVVAKFEQLLDENVYRNKA